MTGDKRTLTCRRAVQVADRAAAAVWELHPLVLLIIGVALIIDAVNG